MTPAQAAEHIERLVTPFRRRSRVELAEALARMVDVRDTADDQLHLIVSAMRSNGDPWKDIAAACGVSVQAAQQRYGKTPKTRPSRSDEPELPFG